MDILDANPVNTLADFAGNFYQKQLLSKFLKPDSDASVAIVVGPNGCGKTSFVCSGFNDYNYEFLRPDYSTIHNHQDFVNIISNFINNKSIACMLNRKEEKKKAIFIDDLNILLNFDRNCVKYISGLISKKIKIIISINVEDEKKVTDFKKGNYAYIQLTNPAIGDCLNYVLELLEKQDIEVDEDLLTMLVKKSKCNIRQIFLNLESFEDIEDVAWDVEYCFSDCSLLDVVGTIFNKDNINLQDLSISISSDPVVISLTMFDNYKQYYANHFKTNKAAFNKSNAFIRKLFVESTLLETYGYNNNDYTLLQMSNLIKCGSIRNLFNTSVRKQKTKQTPIKYTTILSRLLQYYSNQKKINRYTSNNDINIDNSYTLWNVNMLATSSSNHIDSANKAFTPKGDTLTFYNAFSKIKL